MSQGDNPAQASPEATEVVVELDGKDLPAHCPNPKMALWSGHPRVYLDVTSTGQASCPYCGTRYKLKAGAKVSTH